MGFSFKEGMNHVYKKAFKEENALYLPLLQESCHIVCCKDKHTCNKLIGRTFYF